jgi:isoquinoline 1-oxidoreductase alpha subunit
VEGRAQRSCITPLAAVERKHITTIEGLSPDGSHPLQKAWVEEQVSQCGYCQPGQIMTAAAFLAEHPRPSEDEIVQVMSKNLCRCGSYQRILKAVQKAMEGSAA